MMIQVSLCFCPAPDVVKQLELQTQAGIRVRDVLQQAERGHTWLSQLQSKYPSYFESSDIEILIEHLSLGIFSKRVRLDYIMQAGDRLEIYRPLLIDPKEARRLRHKHPPKVLKTVSIKATKS